MVQATRTRLARHGFEVDSLPEIEEVFPIQFRDPERLATRALALHALLGVIFYPQPKEISEWITAERFLPEFTEREREILRITELPEEEMRWKQTALQSNLVTWRAESLYVLLWAAGKIPTLLEPDERMDGSLVADLLPAVGDPIQPFVRDFTMRPGREILAELHYHFFVNHFLEVVYEESGEIAGGLDPMLVGERLQALHWIACADRSEWEME